MRKPKSFGVGGIAWFIFVRTYLGFQLELPEFLHLLLFSNLFFLKICNSDSAMRWAFMSSRNRKCPNKSMDPLLYLPGQISSHVVWCSKFQRLPFSKLFFFQKIKHLRQAGLLCFSFVTPNIFTNKVEIHSNLQHLWLSSECLSGNFLTSDANLKTSQTDILQSMFDGLSYKVDKIAGIQQLTLGMANGSLSESSEKTFAFLRGKHLICNILKHLQELAQLFLSAIDNQ